MWTISSVTKDRKRGSCHTKGFSTSKCPTEEMIGLQTLTFSVHHDQLAAEIRSRTHRTRLFSSLASGQLELSVLGDPAHSVFGCKNHVEEQHESGGFYGKLGCLTPNRIFINFLGVDLGQRSQEHENA